MRASLLSCAAAPAFGQTIDLHVERVGDVVSFQVSGATPSVPVLLAIDPMGCVRDVNGDRVVDAGDVSATNANNGPVTTFAAKIYDQNNDGYVNDLDRDLVAAASGCSDLESIVVPGCSMTADLDPADSIIVSVTIDAAGTGTYPLTIPSGLDLPLYAQVIDVVGCRKSALRADRYVHSGVRVDPMSTMSVVVRTDFAQQLTSGLVEIATDQGTVVSSRNGVGQTRMIDISPLTTGMITVGETPCVYADANGSHDGVALGILQTTSMQTRAYPESLTQFVYQPVAFDVKFGGPNTYAPFNGLWEVIPPAQGPSYAVFDGQLGVLTTTSQIENVLEYYAVPGATAESAPVALFLRVPKEVDLGSGTSGSNGFGISLQNFAGLSGSISVATRHLYTTQIDTVGPQVTVSTVNPASMVLSVRGVLVPGDYLILVNDTPFQKAHDSSPSMPPDLVETSEDSAGPGPCPPGGTPPPPANPPAVPGACEGGMGLLAAISDCVLTGNYSKSTECGTVGPILTASGSMPGGATVKKEVKITHTGSASVSVEFGGVGVEVGTEISVETTETIDYPVPPGNGQNYAFYIYVKVCVTEYRIKSHTWEFPYPFPVCWCCECCVTIHSACQAGQSPAMEVCNH